MIHFDRQFSMMSSRLKIWKIKIILIQAGKVGLNKKIEEFKFDDEVYTADSKKEEQLMQKEEMKIESFFVDFFLPKYNLIIELLRFKLNCGITRKR